MTFNKDIAVTKANAKHIVVIRQGKNTGEMEQRLSSVPSNCLRIFITAR